MQADRFINNPSTPSDTERAQLDAIFTAAEQVELALGTGLFHGFSKMLIVLGQEPPDMDTTVLPTPAPPTTVRPDLADDPHLSLLEPCPDLAARWGDMHAKLWAQAAMSPGVLEACRRRMASMLQAPWALDANPGVTPTDPNDPLCAAALTMAEMFVLDVRGITDEHIATVKELASDDAMVHLTVGLALWDGIYRMASCR